MARTWNPAYHPRDKKGRFTRSATRVMSAADKKRGKKALENIQIRTFGDAGEARTYLDDLNPESPNGALKRYLDGDWRDINIALRAGKPADGVDEIDAAMTELPDDLLLRRQVPLSLFAHVPMTDLVGMKVRDAAYASTSLNIGPTVGGPGVVNMHILAPAGTKAHVNAADGEILLARDIEVAITRVEPDGQGGWDVYGAVLPKVSPRGKAAAKPPEEPAAPKSDTPKTSPGPAPAPAVAPSPDKPAPVDPPTGPAPAPAKPTTAPAVRPASPRPTEPVDGRTFDERVAAAAQKRKALDAMPLSLLPRSRSNPEMTPERARMLKDYLIGETFDIERALKKGGDTPAATADRIDIFDGIMQASPLDRDAIYYQGAPTSRDLFGDAAGGDLTGYEWAEHSYLEVSAIPGPANERAGGRGPVLRILAPKGTGAAALSAGHLQQVLLDRGHTFRVVKDHGRRPDGPRLLDVELVPKAGDEPTRINRVVPKSTSLENPLDPQVAASLPDSPLGRLVESGIIASEPISEGDVADTRLVTFADGTQGIQKIAKANFAGSSQTDLTEGELLASKLGGAIGAPVPDVVRTYEHEVFMEYVASAKPAAAVLARFKSVERGGELEKYIDSREGRLIGILDLISANGDRHTNNWLIKDGKPVGIDHGVVWGSYLTDAVDVAGKEPGFDSPFAGRFFGRTSDGPPGWLPNDLTADDVAWMTERVEALRPDFDALGRGTWLDYALIRLGQLGEHAQGTENRIKP